MLRTLSLLVLPLVAAFAEGAPLIPGSGLESPGATTAKPTGGDPGYTMFIFIGLMVVVFWFVAIRPQKKEERRRRELLAAMKRGDKVVTIGGAHGVIESVGEESVEVRLGDPDKGPVVTFNKGAIGQNLSADAAAKAGDGKK